MKAQTSIAAILTMAATFCPAARADDMNWIYLQFGGANTTQASQGILGGPNSRWNFQAGTVNTGFALNDVTGASSGVSAAWSSAGYIATLAPVPIATANSGQYGPLLDSYIYEPGGALGVVNLSGLNAGAEYSLNLFTQPDANGANRELQFVVTGAGASQGLDTFPSSATQSTLQLGVNYVTFDVYASSTGTVEIDFVGLGSSEADLNGLQLQEIAAAPASATPEPGTVSLMAGGALLCLAAARRKSRLE